MGISFHQRVAIMSANGQTIRHVHGAFAGAMVNGGIAHVEPAIGRVKAVVLSTPVSTHGVRIGEPTPFALGGVRFYRWRRLDESASRIIEHHPRCLY
jgi:hypothetical protein